MNHQRHTDAADAASGAADRLISRIVDSEATAEDHAAFEALAATDPALHDRLAEARRMHGAMSSEVASHLGAFASVKLPLRRAADTPRASDEARTGLRRRIGLAGAWGGWAVAAAMLLGFFMPVDLPFVPHTSGAAGGRERPALHAPQNAGIGFASIDEAMRAYMSRGVESGRVLDPEPRFVLLDARPAESGRVEVRYLRQITERAVVEDLYELAPDDAGRLVPVPVRIQSRNTTAM